MVTREIGLRKLRRECLDVFCCEGVIFVMTLVKSSLSGHLPRKVRKGDTIYGRTRGVVFRVHGSIYFCLIWLHFIFMIFREVHMLKLV